MTNPVTEFTVLEKMRAAMDNPEYAMEVIKTTFEWYNDQSNPEDRVDPPVAIEKILNLEVGLRSFYYRLWATKADGSKGVFVLTDWSSPTNREEPSDGETNAFWEE